MEPCFYTQDQHKSVKGRGWEWGGGHGGCFRITYGDESPPPSSASSATLWTWKNKGAANRCLKAEKLENPFQEQENDSGWSSQPPDLVPVAVNLEKGSHNFALWTMHSILNPFWLETKKLLPSDHQSYIQKASYSLGRRGILQRVHGKHSIALL